MDNNNFNPPVPNQPVQPQMPYPNGQYPYQPQYPQPQMRPPKQPMDPAKKKKIILISSICSGVVVLGIVAAIVIPILLRVDYAPAYAAVKELKPKVYDIYRSYDCEYVVDYVDSTYTSIKAYSEYIENCKATYSAGADDLVTKLENTDAVKRNDEIKAQFSKFKSEYSKLSSGDNDTLIEKLNLWQARHNFVYTADDLSYSSSSDAEFTTAANYLINSGNDALKTYGEGWLERSIAVAAAYRAYRSASWQTSSQLYTEYTNKRNEFNDWKAANRPDIKTVAPLNFDDTSKMYSEFSTLYNLISETYEQNYNSGSGDCTEFLGEVYCE